MQQMRRFLFKTNIHNLPNCSIIKQNCQKSSWNMSLHSGMDSILNGSKPLGKIVLLGDSLTQRSFDPDSGCWGAHLANKFQRMCDVYARAFSGYNTRWFRQRLPQITASLNESNPDSIACVIVWLGANDANQPDSCSGQHVPIEEYSVNLSQIVEYLHKNVAIPKKRLLLLTPPPYIHEAFAATCVPTEIPSKSAELTEKYAQMCAKVGKECGITVVDVHQAIKSQPNYGQFLEDGLHLNRVGGEFVFKLLEPYVVDKYEQWSGDKFDPNRMWMPYWKDIAMAPNE